LVVVNVSRANIEQSDTSGDSNINYQLKSKFYQDLRTKLFLKQIFVKEKMLIQMVRNIADEIQARENNIQALNDVEFDLVYGTGEEVCKQYNSETDMIENIITELDKFEFIIQRREDLKLITELEKVKDKLIETLDNNNFGIKTISNQEITQKINEYLKTKNSLLKIYNSIVAFQKLTSKVDDKEVFRLFEQQKTRIINILEESRLAGSFGGNVVQDYIKDATSAINILKQISPLNVFVESDSNALVDVDQLQANIIAGLDERIFRLIGNTRQEAPSERTIASFFKIWKQKKRAEFQAHYTKYRIVKDYLINSSTNEERNRMLENDVCNALSNYTDEEYELAGMQLKQIYNTYSYFYQNLDGVIFYQGEANYANHYFDSARKNYLNIIKNYPNSKYAGQCYLRLLMISYTFSEHEKFIDYYTKLDKFKNIEKDEKNKADLLAAHILARTQDFDKINELFKNFDRKSKYFVKAKYLHGISLTYLKKYIEVEKLYEQIVDNKRYNRTDKNISIIKNESLLKLGFIHYKNGGLEKALSCFTQISNGFPKYEKSLIGQPESNSKNCLYDFVINRTEQLCNNFLMSNYASEGFVLSAFCKRIQQGPGLGLAGVLNETKSKQIFDPAIEYSKKRDKILRQLDELKILEERILERQNKILYPIIIKTRALIDEALTSFCYRGAVNSRMLAEYTNGRKKVVRQIQELEKIIIFVKEQNNREQLANVLQQGKDLMTVLGENQLQQSISNSSYFLDDPSTPKEGAIIYRPSIVDEMFNELIREERHAQKDMEAIADLVQSQNKGLSIELTLNLEILEEGFVNLSNHLNRFQVWLTNHKTNDSKTQDFSKANFSKFAGNDINFALLREKKEKLSELHKIVSKIENVLEIKKDDLQTKITRFDQGLEQLRDEMEKEIIRQEKLEKERYFQEKYFETKTSENVTKPAKKKESPAFQEKQKLH